MPGTKANSHFDGSKMRGKKKGKYIFSQTSVVPVV